MRWHLCRRVPRGGVAPDAARGLGAAARRTRRKTRCKPGAGDRQDALPGAGRPPRRRRARARPLSPATPPPPRAAACRRDPGRSRKAFSGGDCAGSMRKISLISRKLIVCYANIPRSTSIQLGFTNEKASTLTQNKLTKSTKSLTMSRVVASALPMATTPASGFEQRIGAVRRFNRLYTRRIGVLQDGFLQSPYSLAEARVLYELAHRERPTATELAADLGLDHGYLSRILRGFNERGFITKTPSPHDRRQILLSLTVKGRMAFAPLDQRSQNEIAAMIGKLSAADQGRVVAAMGTIESVLGEAPTPQIPYVLRPPRPGDMGWIVARHGGLYGEEYGWDERIEALTAEIVATFVRNHDRKRERCWIAEREGENVGSVLLMRDSEEAARLRLLLVEPKARGLGIGARLVEEALRFAREARYRKVTLWTQSVLTAARGIYERAGFKLVQQESHDTFGKELMGETWELELR